MSKVLTWGQREYLFFTWKRGTREAEGANGDMENKGRLPIEQISANVVECPRAWMLSGATEDQA
jgi:hypothetical protein